MNEMQRLIATLGEVQHVITMNTIFKNSIVVNRDCERCWVNNPLSILPPEPYDCNKCSRKGHWETDIEGVAHDLSFTTIEENLLPF